MHNVQNIKHNRCNRTFLLGINRVIMLVYLIFNSSSIEKDKAIRDILSIEKTIWAHTTYKMLWEKQSSIIKSWGLWTVSKWIECRSQKVHKDGEFILTRRRAESEESGEMKRESRWICCVERRYRHMAVGT